MRLIFIRHGDPDYSIDSLTEKGWKEAKALSNRVSKWQDIDEFYVSPLGRAKDTASFSLEKLNRTAIELPWLKEFYVPVVHPQYNRPHVPWDFYPEYWTKYPEYYDKDNWYNSDLFKEYDVESEYRKVTEGIDNILSQYGYKRHDNFYLSDGTGKDKTLVFFCHLGVTLLIMGYLQGVSPVEMWHNFFVAPTSVTVLNTEERDEGKAYFRCQVLGDTTHLHDANEPISEAGSFTDIFQN